MPYGFDEPVDREMTYSLKWDVERGTAPMWVADMDFRCAPAIVEAVVGRARQGVFGYTKVPPGWNAAVVSWWRERHGLALDPDGVVFASGVIPSLAAAVRAFAGGGAVAVLSPGYNCFPTAIRNGGCKVAEVELDYRDGAYAIDFGRLEAVLSREDVRLLLLSNPHNPTGTVWAAADLARLGELCAAHGAIVVSDEIHCDIMRPGRRHVPFQAASATCARVSVTCSSPSKPFNMAGLQSAYCFSAERDLLDRVAGELAAAGHNVPNAFAVQAAMAAYGRGGAWLDSANAYLFETRSRVEGYLAAHSEMGIDPVAADATYLCWLDCARLLRAGGRSSTHSFQRLLRAEHRVFVYPGMIYGSGGKPFLRMNIATRRALVEDALGRMRRACAEWLG